MILKGFYILEMEWFAKNDLKYRMARE